ncbi:MAG: class I tRNA ligase family protein, partial [Candidatus Kaiserbacteria bacterium]|nr:class I tRNA ligase family protein [Candidatus Kaiserbacteria bacterium]
SFDWIKEVVTCETNYYHWTQWLFVMFFDQGLADSREAAVKLCPKDQTVLANEQVTDGCCERCGTPVEEKRLTQWFLKITDYAERLLTGLDALPWREEIKDAQRAWIGKSEGAYMEFQISGRNEKIKVFTTRSDTIFGATYVVLAPEHELVSSFLSIVSNKKQVEEYVNATKKKTERERSENKEKTGVKLEGVSAINPATKEEIPIYAADYVLGSYGTGAIMAVPALDERDNEFARKFNLPIRETELADWDTIEKIGGEKATQYRLRDWLVSRQRYWGCPIPIVYDPEGKPHAIPAEHLPWILPTDVDFTPTGKAPLASSKELKERVTKIFGEGWTPEYDTLDTFVDSSWYFLRYLDPKDAQSFSDFALMKKWLPINRYSGGSEHTTMHVLYARFFMKALYDFALVPVDEPFTERFNRGLIMGPDGQKMSKSKGNVINPDEFVQKYGADAVRVYLAFIGPYNEPGNYPWNLDGVTAMRKFLERIVRMIEKVDQNVGSDERTIRLIGETSNKINEDGDKFKFNTAIAALMILLNHLDTCPTISCDDAQKFIIMLAPFAPHLAEHLWGKIGEAGSVHQQPWPEISLDIASEVEVVAQVNGKRRGSITIAVDVSESEATAEALKLTAVVKALGGKEPSRVVFVPNKIVNFVVPR